MANIFCALRVLHRFIIIYVYYHLKTIAIILRKKSDTLFRHTILREWGYLSKILEQIAKKP